jgi:hypothetical protein
MASSEMMGIRGLPAGKVTRAELWVGKGKTTLEQYSWDLMVD